MNKLLSLSKATKLSMLILTGAAFTTVATIDNVSESTAYFTANTSTAGDKLGTGKLQIELAEGESVGSQFVISDLVPGDYVERDVTVKNTGNVAFDYKVSVLKGTNTSPLWSDVANGLQIQINNGTMSSVNNFVQNNVVTIPAGGTSTMKVKIMLPATADNTFQNQTQDLKLTFTATSKEGAKR
ncbi:Fn3-like domain-containing protein [Niallia taxi]|uniref:Fn3-like domain-containing protein n=1 Tax=Niallia taxi TaxID=2499688 RepID=UPI00203E62DB|nr:Fn3-like domain-containing protein [Niallia taxi]MCM3212930.1 Fn3-like domain-containing protein [Niallia taxi]